MGPGWKLLSAWATETLAIEEMEKIKLSVMSPHDREQAKNPPTGWRFWVKKGHHGIGGANGLPVTWIHVWHSNLTGSRNPWSYVAVARLHIQGNVLDQIIEEVEKA